MATFATMTTEAFDATLEKIGRDATKAGFATIATVLLFFKNSADTSGKVSRVNVDRAKLKIGAIYNDDMARKLVTGASAALVALDALIVASCDKGNLVPEQVKALRETLQ